MRPSLTPRQAVLCLFALALCLRLYHIDYRGLWTDEFTTLEAIQLQPDELVYERLSRGHFPTYFLILSAWTHVAGASEWALRFPSAVAGALAVPYVFLIALPIWGFAAAAFASFFFLLNERMIWASQEARPYAFAVLAACASLHALLRALQTRRPAWMAAFAAWTLFGLSLHATYGFVFAAQFLVVSFWLVRRRDWRWDWALTAAALLVVEGALLGVVAGLRKNDVLASGAAWPPWNIYRDGMLELVWGEYGMAFGSAFKYAGLALGSALVVLAWRGSRRKQEPGDGAALSSLLFTLSAAWAISVLASMTLLSGLYRDMIHGTRYYSLGAGGAALLAGLAVASVRRRHLRWALFVACLLLQVPTSAAWLHFRGDGAREGARYIAKRLVTNEPVLFCHDSHADLIAEHYRLAATRAGISRNVKDPKAVEQFVSNAVGADAPGFWLFLYKEEKSPLQTVAKDWAAGRFELGEKKRFHLVNVIHYRRAAAKAGTAQ